MCHSTAAVPRRSPTPGETGRGWGRTSHHGCPTPELMTLVETGTRALLGAVFGPTAEGGTSYASRLLHLLRPDMLVLWDKGFDGNDSLASVTAARARFLGRLRSNRRTPVLTRLADGSYPSVIAAEKVRVIDADITVTCADGTVFTGSYRLVTSLTDVGRYPAAVLVGLCHQRWEHESAYYALHHTIMNGRVLCSGDPAGVEQEMWVLLTPYQALRTMMVDAAESLPGTDPGRCCFTVAFQTARDQVVQAAAVITDPADVGRVGLTGHRILACLLPPRRQRVSTRKVKSPMSRCSNRHEAGRPGTSRTITTVDISVLEPREPHPQLPAMSRDDRNTAPRRPPPSPDPWPA
nr:transposase [Streptomyces sp. SID8352]